MRPSIARPHFVIWGNPVAQFVATELTRSAAPTSTRARVSHGMTVEMDSLESSQPKKLFSVSTAVYHANLLNRLVRSQAQHDKGYPGGNNVVLALERREVQGQLQLVLVFDHQHQARVGA